jgi:ring-1,2-phenylacetyl-CoA epoxidase subunit PaaE
MSDGGNFIAFTEGPGMALVLPTVETLLSRNARAHVHVFYGSPTREQAESAEKLLALKDRYLDRLALHFVMSDEPQEIDWLNGRLDAHKVATMAGKLFDPMGVRQYIVCGPGAMNADIGSALQKLGVPPAHIHLEPYSSENRSVGACEAATPVHVSAAHLRAAPVAANMTEVTVIMDGRRRTFSMKMNEDTVLEAAEKAGLDLPFSCKAGVCATCRTKLLKGKVELAQNYALEDWELEQGFILACQAHAKTPELEITYDET